MLRTLSVLQAGAAAALLASLTPAFSATTTTTPAAAATKPWALRTTVFDRAVDPMTAAIKTALTDSAKRGFVDKGDRAGLVAYYTATGNAPVWTMDGKLTDHALAVIARLKQADADGLDASVFVTPDVALGTVAPASLQDLANADVMLSQAVITYAHQARAGRLDPNAVSLNISYTVHLPDPVQVMTNVSTAADPAAALASYNPNKPEFLALRDALAAARADKTPRPPMIPDGSILRVGVTDARVPTLRERLAVPAPADVTALNKYDQPLADAVKLFQSTAGLNPDGIVGPATLAAVNTANIDRVGLILANMERWRWMPDDMGAFYVRVNIPNYNLDIYQGGSVIWTTRVVVGKVTNQTPIFSDQMEYVDVNPVWNVPSSIAVKEMLPDILKNPAVALAGYDVYYNANGRFDLINPLSIDWRKVDMNRIQIKQPPGEANALGAIKFMFPNQFDVYLHDTPAKELFSDDYRADSHGCVRVQDPWGFADVLMTQEKGLTTAQLKRLVGGQEQEVDFPTKIAVHLTYFTAWVDASGKLQVRGDIYGLDALMEKSLGIVSA